MIISNQEQNGLNNNTMIVKAKVMGGSGILVKDCTFALIFWILSLVKNTAVPYFLFMVENPGHIWDTRDKIYFF